MKYQHISGREADKRRRLLRDIQSAKRHKDLQELHEFKEKMRAGAESASKINELRRIEGGTWRTSNPGRAFTKFGTSLT